MVKYVTYTQNQKVRVGISRVHNSEREIGDIDTRRKHRRQERQRKETGLCKQFTEHELRKIAKRHALPRTRQDWIFQRAR